MSASKKMQEAAKNNGLLYSSGDTVYVDPVKAANIVFAAEHSFSNGMDSVDPEKAFGMVKKAEQEIVLNQVASRGKVASM